MNKRFLLTIAGLLTLMHPALAQPARLQVGIRNMPFNSATVGYMNGDRFVFADSLYTRNAMTAGGQLKTVSWLFPPEAPPGVYRVVFGKTTYARVMDEPPQSLDFIYNGEHIGLETDFKAPADSIRVVESEENRLWYAFLRKEREFRHRLGELELEGNYFQDQLAGYLPAAGNDEKLHLEARAVDVANAFNLLQMERENFISGLVDENAHMFASRIIKNYRESFRDGYLSEPERQDTYRKNYFLFIDFSDEALLITPVFTEKIFDYLVTYNQKDYSHEQRQDAYTEAVDAIMREVIADAGQGGPVYKFVLDYLVDGFERLKMNRVLAWISDKYADGL